MSCTMDRVSNFYKEKHQSTPYLEAPFLQAPIIQDHLQHQPYLKSIQVMAHPPTWQGKNCINIEKYTK